MLRRAIVVASILVLFPLSATADEQIPIKTANDLKGTWSGPIGFGAFGSTTTGTMRLVIKEDGSFTSTTESSGGGTFRGAGQGRFEPKPDGTVAVSGTYSTGTWRLFDVSGRRTIRSETRQRNNGQGSWGEFTQEP